MIDAPPARSGQHAESNGKVKIVHLTSVHVPFDTRIFQKECRTLAKKNYDVVLVAAHNGDQIVDDVVIRGVPKAGTRLQRMTLTAWRVVRTAWRENGSIFHIHDPELLPWGQFLRIAGKRVIYDMHENFPEALLTKFWLPPRLRGLLSRFFKGLESILIYKMPVIFAEECYVPSYAWIKKSVVVLNMPLHPQHDPAAAPKYDKPTVGYIGSVTRERGLFTTLEALSILKRLGYSVDWECVGPLHGIDQSELAQDIEQEVRNGIRFRGYMLPEEGQKLMARCQIGLAILKPVPNLIDKQNTKLFEYMALGLPIVVSDFPIFRDIVEKDRCGLCVNPEDPADVAKAIRWLIDNPREAEMMGRNGMDAVQRKYSWQTEAEKLQVFYRDLLAGEA